MEKEVDEPIFVVQFDLTVGDFIPWDVGRPQPASACCEGTYLVPLSEKMLLVLDEVITGTGKHVVGYIRLVSPGIRSSFSELKKWAVHIPLPEVMTVWMDRSGFYYSKSGRDEEPHELLSNDLYNEIKKELLCNGLNYTFQWEWED